MAKAKKCDLCKNFYELDEAHDYKGYALRFLVEKMNGDYCHNGTIMDCCPDCAASIDRHLDILKNQIKESANEHTI